MTKRKNNSYDAGGLRSYLIRVAIGLIIGGFGTALSFGLLHVESNGLGVLMLNGINHGIITVALLLLLLTKNKEHNIFVIALVGTIMTITELSQILLPARVFEWWDLVTPLLVLSLAWWYNKRMKCSEELF